jgi:hypothetical protein
MVSFMPGPLYHHGKSPRHQLDRWLGGPQSRSGREAPSILTSALHVTGQLHVPVALPPGEEPSVHMDTRLGGSQIRAGSGDEETNSLPL